MASPSLQERPEQRRGQRLLFVAVLFAVLFTFPFLGVVDQERLVAGIPVLYLYVFVVWVLLVLLTGWLVRRRKE